MLKHSVESELAQFHVGFGSVYENFVAQKLHAHGFPLYYFNSRKVGEVDFLVEVTVLDL